MYRTCRKNYSARAEQMYRHVPDFQFTFERWETAVLKRVLRQQILDRAPTEYPGSVIHVLLKIVDLTSVDDWKTDHVENFYSKPKSISELAFLTSLERHTVKRAMNSLLRAGILTPNPHVENSYRVHPEVVHEMKSSYLGNHSKALAEKILHNVRMRFTRNPDRKPEWQGVHPVGCACVHPFCSHPTSPLSV